VEGGAARRRGHRQRRESGDGGSEPPDCSNARGGLRILDWIDQALLWTSCSNETRELSRVTDKVGFGLYVAFRQADLIHESVAAARDARRYDVTLPAKNFLDDVEPRTVRNILTWIVHTSNFEAIRQMRDQRAGSPAKCSTPWSVRPLLQLPEPRVQARRRRSRYI